LDAAETKFLGCVQTMRSPAWSEFGQPPSGESAYTAWAKRFEAASDKTSDRCQRQEGGAATAICKLMQQDQPMCRAWLIVLTGDIMNGHTICDTTHCVKAR
jgi:hypothetical protein